MFGIDDPPGALVAAATVTLPDEGPPPDALIARREALWADLGADARARYEGYGVVSRGLLKLPRHHHLNMIGVRRAHTGAASRAAWWKPSRTWRPRIRTAPV